MVYTPFQDVSSQQAMKYEHKRKVSYDQDIWIIEDDISETPHNDGFDDIKYMGNKEWQPDIHVDVSTSIF
jgi:hypothetical protein